MDNSQFSVWNKAVRLPMSGTVVTVVNNQEDNDPDILAAIGLADVGSGSHVTLEEKRHNLLELRVGGEQSPFLLRLLHLKKHSIPDDIKVGHAPWTHCPTPHSISTPL